MSFFDNLDDSFSPTTNKYEFDYNLKDDDGDDDDDDDSDDDLLLQGGPAFKKKTKAKQTQQTRKDNKMLDNLNQFMLQEEERFVAKKTILDMDESRERVEKKEEEEEEEEEEETNTVEETAGDDDDDDIIVQDEKENHYESEEEEGERKTRRVPILTTTKKRKEINDVDSNSNKNNNKKLMKKQSNEDEYWKEIHNIVNRCANNEQRAKRRQKLQDAADGIEFNSQDYDDDELLLEGYTNDNNNKQTMNSVTTTSYQSDLLSSMKSIMKVDDMMDMDVSAWNSKRRKDMASANLTGLSVNLGCRKIFFIPSNSNAVKSPSLDNNNNDDDDEKKIASTTTSSSSSARAARAIARRRTAKAIDEEEKKKEASSSLSPEEKVSYNFDSKQNAIKTLTNIITDLSSSSSSSSSPSLTVINQALLTPMKKAIQSNHLSFYLANLSFRRIISPTSSSLSFGEIPIKIIIWLWKVACSSFPDDCILSEGAYRLVHEWISSFHNDKNSGDEDGGSLLVPDDEKHEFFLFENIMNGFKFATGYNDTLLKSNDDDDDGVDVIQKRMSSSNSNSMVELQQPPQCKNNNAVVSNNAIRDRSNDNPMMPLDPFVMKHFLLLFNASLKTNKLIHTTTTTTKERQNAITTSTNTTDDIAVRNDDHHLNLAKEYLQIFLFSSLDPCFYQGNGLLEPLQNLIHSLLNFILSEFFQKEKKKNTTNNNNIKDNCKGVESSLEEVLPSSDQALSFHKWVESLAHEIFSSSSDEDKVHINNTFTSFSSSRTKIENAADKDDLEGWLAQALLVNNVPILKKKKKKKKKNLSSSSSSSSSLYERKKYDSQQQQVIDINCIFVKAALAEKLLQKCLSLSMNHSRASTSDATTLLWNEKVNQTIVELQQQQQNESQSENDSTDPIDTLIWRCSALALIGFHETLANLPKIQQDGPRFHASLMMVHVCVEIAVSLLLIQCSSSSSSSSSSSDKVKEKVKAVYWVLFKIEEISYQMKKKITIAVFANAHFRRAKELLGWLGTTYKGWKRELQEWWVVNIGKSEILNEEEEEEEEEVDEEDESLKQSTLSECWVKKDKKDG